MRGCVSDCMCVHICVCEEVCASERTRARVCVSFEVIPLRMAVGAYPVQTLSLKGICPAYSTVHLH